MANEAFYVAETRQSFPMVTTTEEITETTGFGAACGAQGASVGELFESLESSRDNGCQQQLWCHVGCCMGWRGPSAGPNSSAGGTDARRAAASALNGVCDALSARSNRALGIYFTLLM